MALAVGLPFGLIAASSTPAWAVVKVNATNYKVHCTSITGTISFSPALKLPGTTSGAEKSTVKLTLGGCTATPTTGGTAVTVTKGVVSGALTGSGGSACTGLLGSSAQSGTLTTKWTTSPALSSGSTVLTPHTVLGGTNGTNGTFSIPGAVPPSATGSFQGTDGGASTIASAVTSQTVTQLLTSCGTALGLKSVSIASGTLTSQ